MDRGLLAEKYEIQRKSFVEATNDLKEKIKKLEGECSELENEEKGLRKKLETSGCKRLHSQKKEYSESEKPSNELKKYCMQCGNLVNGAKYCSKCGEKVN